MVHVTFIEAGYFIVPGSDCFNPTHVYTFVYRCAQLQYVHTCRVNSE